MGNWTILLKDGRTLRVKGVQYGNGTADYLSLAPARNEPPTVLLNRQEIIAAVEDGNFDSLSETGKTA